MKLNVVIKAGKVSQEIVIPVGDGRQSFKWLALAAANRLVGDGARNGRHLPHRRDRQYLPAKTTLLPKNVYHSECPFLHPNDIINAHVSDSQTINVDLYMPMEFDDYGSPVLSKWAFIAFRHHERHEEKREKFTEEKRLEVESFKQETTERARLQKIELERPKILLMKQVMKDQIIDDQLIEAAMTSEWNIIKDSGVLETIVPDHNHQEEIKLFFISNYIELTDCYKFYSAVNSGGGTHTIEYIELCKFITETGVLTEEHSNAILKVFLESHIRGIDGKGTKSKPSIHSKICQTEFFVALIKIAIYKNITIPKKEIAKLRRSGQNVSNKKATMPTVPTALKMVYKDYILPVLTKMPAGSEMRNAVASDEVLLVIHDHMDKLAKAFEMYVIDDDSSVDINDEEESKGTNGGEPNGAMTCKQFSVFASDAGFLGGNEKIRRFSVTNLGRKNSVIAKGKEENKMGVTQKDVRQIFAASQHNLEATEEEKKAVEEDEDVEHHQELMVFSEFLEGIARLGVLKFGSHEEDDETKAVEEKLSYYECIKRGVERAISVVDSDA